MTERELGEGEIIGYMAWEPQLGLHDLEVGKTYTAAEAFLDWHHANKEYDNLYITTGEPMNFSEYSPDAKSLFDDRCVYYRVVFHKNDILEDFGTDEKSVGKVTILERMTRDDIVYRQIKIAQDAPEFMLYRPRFRVCAAVSNIAVANMDARLTIDGYAQTVAISGYGSTVFIDNCYLHDLFGGCVTFAAAGQCSAVAALANYSSFALSGSHSFIEARGTASSIATSGACAEISIKSVGAKAAVSGAFSAIKSTAKRATIAITGSYSTSSIEGEDNVLAIVGKEGRFRGVNGTPVCVADYGEDGKCRGFVTGRIGENGLKENTFYTVEDGRFVEAPIVDKVVR